MGIKELVNESYKTAKDKGFWPESGRNVGEMLMLVTSELGEALEAHRKGRMKTDLIEQYKVEKAKDLFSETYPYFPKDLFEANVKDSFADEIADTFIRLFDLCGGLNIDIEFHIKEKMAYNKTRERLHGKKY